MNKLVTTAMVAVLGLFGAIEDGRVTLVSSASATPQNDLGQIYGLINSFGNNPAVLTAQLAALLEANPAIIQSLSVLINSGSLNPSIIQIIGMAMAQAHQTLSINGNAAGANMIQQTVATLSPAVQAAYAAASASVGGFGGFGGAPAPGPGAGSESGHTGGSGGSPSASPT